MTKPPDPLLRPGPGHVRIFSGRHHPQRLHGWCLPYAANMAAAGLRRIGKAGDL